MNEGAEKEERVDEEDEEGRVPRADRAGMKAKAEQSPLTGVDDRMPHGKGRSVALRRGGGRNEAESDGR